MNKLPGRIDHMSLSDPPKDMAVRITVETSLDRDPGRVGAFSQKSESFAQGGGVGSGRSADDKIPSSG